MHNTKFQTCSLHLGVPVELWLIIFYTDIAHMQNSCLQFFCWHKLGLMCGRSQGRSGSNSAGRTAITNGLEDKPSQAVALGQDRAFDLLGFLQTKESTSQHPEVSHCRDPDRLAKECIQLHDRQASFCYGTLGQASLNKLFQGQKFLQPSSHFTFPTLMLPHPILGLCLRQGLLYQQIEIACA